MKRFILPLILIVCYLTGNSQPTYKKIKVILLGTFHFNQSIDSAGKLQSHLFSEKRQNEVTELVSDLVKQKPDKIFLEFTESSQHYYDSIYNDYLNAREPVSTKTKANEIFQLGMRTAKQLGHKKVYGMNYQPEELKDSSYHPRNDVDKAMKDLYMALNNYDDSTRTNASFYDLPVPYKLPNQDSLLQVSTLSQFILYLNSSKKMMRDEYTNWNYLYSMGTGTDMSMTDYVGSFWYGTNLRNFNNVLRTADYKNDNCYLIIYGSSHIPILTYFFKMHPYFEVVDLDKVLSEKTNR